MGKAPAYQTGGLSTLCRRFNLLIGQTSCNANLPLSQLFSFVLALLIFKSPIECWLGKRVRANLKP